MANFTGLNYLSKTYKAAKTAAAISKKKYNQSLTNYERAVNTRYAPSKQVQTYRRQSDDALHRAKAMGDFKYTSKYTPQAENALKEAADMKFKMNYSLQDDPAYQQYRDQFVHQGQMAAQEAAGNAVQQTGGYGSTAAVAAGQQAYNESLTHLNDIVPELYNQAYQREWNQFENERNTLFQLADAYKNMDAQAYDQALGTWSTNYNRWIQLAEEYNSKYEYLDGAERKDYENRLQGLYNILTATQDQYQSDMSLTQQAARDYAGGEMDIANYKEQVRSNKAGEALDRARLNETVRSNKASEAAAAAAAALKSGEPVKGKQYTSGKSGKAGNDQYINKTVKDAGISVQLPTLLIQRVGMNRTDTGRINEIQRLAKAGDINETQKNALYAYFKLHS